MVVIRPRQANSVNPLEARQRWCARGAARVPSSLAHLASSRSAISEATVDRAGPGGSHFAWIDHYDLLLSIHEVRASRSFDPAVSTPVIPVAIAITLDCRPGWVAIRKKP